MSSPAIVDYDRARFGKHREQWQHEVTQQKLSELTILQRLRKGHNWTGLTDADVDYGEDYSNQVGLHEPCVTRTHWKDHWVALEDSRVKELAASARELSEEVGKRNAACDELIGEKIETYETLCRAKYSQTNLQGEAVRLEEDIKVEKNASAVVGSYFKDLAFALQVEKQTRCLESLHADFLEKKRLQRLEQRESLPCCAQCCTACCWHENYWTKLFLRDLFPGCKCCGTPCCQKEFVLDTLRIDTIHQAWERKLPKYRQTVLQNIGGK